MARASRNFAVIGLGAFGSTVAQELTRYGNRVLGLDTDEKRVAQLAPTLTQAMILDATDEAALREAGLESYDVALVAIGSDIQASILTTMNLRLLGIGTLWVKAASKTHHRILAKLGADRVILPEQEMGRHTAQMLNNPFVQDYVNLGNGFSVVNVALPARLGGTTIADLRIARFPELRLLGVMRGTEYLEPSPSAALRADDKLILLGRRAELRQFADVL